MTHTSTLFASLLDRVFRFLRFVGESIYPFLITHFCTKNNHYIAQYVKQLSIHTSLYSLSTWLAVAFTLGFYGLRALQWNHAHLFAPVTPTFLSLWVRAFQWSHAHLFAPVAFTLWLLWVKGAFHWSHAYLFALVVLKLFVLNCAFHGVFPRCSFDFSIRRITR